MTLLIRILPAALLLSAAADTARGDAVRPTGPVAEIVAFSLVPGITEAAFLDAARAMQPAVARAPGFVSRRLSRNADGTWTDYVVWTDLDRAEAAAREVFADPVTKPFVDAIDGASIDMRHEPILMTAD